MSIPIDKQEEFCGRIVASEDLNLYRLAKEAGLSWSRDVSPALKNDPDFYDRVNDAIQCVRFTYIGILSRAARYGKQGAGGSVDSTAIKDILRLIDTQSILLPKTAKEGRSLERTADIGDIEEHLNRLNLNDKDANEA